jgi:peptide-methionine (S)-S-oxide reductase
VFDKPIVTTLEPLGSGGFHPAEQYHQDFARINPQHPYVLQWSVPKTSKLKQQFPQLVKPNPATEPSK